MTRCARTSFLTPHSSAHGLSACVSLSVCRIKQILYRSVHRLRHKLHLPDNLDPREGLLIKRPASLTVEAALELPLFFVIIAIVLQYAVVFRAAGQFSGSLTAAAEELAIAAYKEEYGDSKGLIRGVLSDAWAASLVRSGSPDKDAVRNMSFLGSSYMEKDDRIRIVLSYRPKPKFSLVSLPFTFFVQKASVRGWTGRLGSAGRKTGSDEEGSASRKVYVTDSGSVYHTDPDCSHLKVTVIPVTKDGLAKARNRSGSRYHRCPYCGKNETGRILVDPYGECWHTSLSCPSLKRSVNTVPLEECESLRECKDCAKKHSHQ